MRILLHFDRVDGVAVLDGADNAVVLAAAALAGGGVCTRAVGRRRGRGRVHVDLGGRLLCSVGGSLLLGRERILVEGAPVAIEALALALRLVRGFEQSAQTCLAHGKQRLLVRTESEQLVVALVQHVLGKVRQRVVALGRSGGPERLGVESRVEMSERVIGVGAARRAAALRAVLGRRVCPRHGGWGVGTRNKYGMHVCRAKME